MNEIDLLNSELIDVKTEITLIKFRDVIKNIIDLFCKALNIDLYFYKDKIDLLKKIIPKKELKQEIKKQLVEFFDIILNHLDDSNTNAHSLDLDQDILAQLFSLIDPKDELKTLREGLEKGNIATVGRHARHLQPRPHHTRLLAGYARTRH